MSKRIFSGTGLIIAAILFVAVNIAANGTFRNAKLDLTEEKLYTLSQGSRNVLAKLDEPIRLKLYFSASLAEGLPRIKTYGTRVRELLEEYAAISDGQIRLEVIDPEPFSEAEDAAALAGLQGAPVDASGQTFYFGLVGTNSTDDQEIVPFFQESREQFLEYELTRLVHNLTDPELPRVGIVSSLPLQFGPGGMMAAMQGRSRPYAIVEQINQSFDVTWLDGKLEQLNDEIDVLLLVHPKDLSDSDLYAIDQYVLGGGKVLAFVDPHAETAARIPGPTGQPDPMADHSSSLDRLFTAWGVELVPGKLVGDRALAHRVGTAGQGRRQVVDYVLWHAIGPDNVDADDVVTGELGQLNLATPGALRPLDGATTSLAPLVFSSRHAALLDAEPLKLGPDPEKLLREFSDSGEVYTLAARITGPVKSAFDAAPPEEEGKEPATPKPHLAEAKQPANLILVADADLLDDMFWTQRQNFLGQELLLQTAANAVFLVNALDNLSGSGDLISLRSRGRSARPFTAVEAIRRDADQAFLAKEAELEQRIAELEKRIAELQSQSAQAGGSILNEEQSQAIAEFQKDMIQSRRELREVQRSLRRDIENLGSWLKFINIGLIPILVGGLTLVLAALRRQRAKARAGLA